MRAPNPDHGLRELMAQAAAAATAASAASVDLSFTAPAHASARGAQRTPSRAGSSRRHSAGNRIAEIQSGDASNATPLPPPTNGQRLATIDAVARDIETHWQHPHNSQQYKTQTLHRLRAILYMKKTLVTQSFVSAATGISQASLSHYVRGLFKGNQSNIEERIGAFVDDFANGKHDHVLEDVRNAPRPGPVPQHQQYHHQQQQQHQHQQQLVQQQLVQQQLVQQQLAQQQLAQQLPVTPDQQMQLQQQQLQHAQLQQAQLHQAQLYQAQLQQAHLQHRMQADPASALSTPVSVARGGHLAPAESPAHHAPAPAPPQLHPVPWGPPVIPRLSQPGTPVQRAASPPSNVVLQTPETPHTAPPTVPHTPNTADKPPLTDRARRAAKRRASDGARPRAALPRPVFPPVPDEAEERPLTPMLAVERAYHALVAPVWSDEHPDTEPLLLPIELFVKRDSKLLHMYTQWDVNERHLSPEVVAERIRRARGLPPEFAEPAAKQIRLALFRAGVICPAPPHAPEDRRRIRLFVKLKDADVVHTLDDEFEWDISMPALNSPEVFAQHLCVDAGVPQRHAATVAREIRKLLNIAQGLAYGDERTKKLARAQLPDDDPVLTSLTAVQHALTHAAAAERRARERADNVAVVQTVVDALVADVGDEAERRAEKRELEAERQRMEREMEKARKRDELAAKKRRVAELEALREVNQQANQLLSERNLDFRPYLALRVGRDERPCLWIPPAIDRRRRKQLTFPMTPQARKSVGGRASGGGASASGSGRASKRRRVSRREESAEERRIVVRLRIRKPEASSSSSGRKSGERKRRR